MLAVATAVVTSQTGAGTSPDAVLSGFRPGLEAVAGIAAAGLTVALVGVRAQRHAAQAVPQETG